MTGHNATSRVATMIRQQRCKEHTSGYRAGCEACRAYGRWYTSTRQKLLQQGKWESAVSMPHEFVIPGETRASAALEVARSVLRRAERRIVALAFVEPVAPVLQAYVNRVADWVWVLARAAEQAEHVAPTKLRG